MSKVITFSTFFPAYSQYRLMKTNFEEKILSGEKKHTIRAGNRWKVGDKFSPRVWTSKPYHSPQKIICDDLTICKIYEFKILEGRLFLINNCTELYVDKDLITKIAQNDGLTLTQFDSWFKGGSKDFEGQIICWDPTFEYY